MREAPGSASIYVQTDTASIVTSERGGGGDQGTGGRSDVDDPSNGYSGGGSRDSGSFDSQGGSFFGSGDIYPVPVRDMAEFWDYALGAEFHENMPDSIKFELGAGATEQRKLILSGSLGGRGWRPAMNLERTFDKVKRSRHLYGLFVVRESDENDPSYLNKVSLDVAQLMHLAMEEQDLLRQQIKDCNRHFQNNVDSCNRFSLSDDDVDSNLVRLYQNILQFSLVGVINFNAQRSFVMPRLIATELGLGIRTMTYAFAVKRKLVDLVDERAYKFVRFLQRYQF